MFGGGCKTCDISRVPRGPHDVTAIHNTNIRIYVLLKRGGRDERRNKANKGGREAYRSSHSKRHGA